MTCSPVKKAAIIQQRSVQFSRRLRNKVSLEETQRITSTPVAQPLTLGQDEELLRIRRIYPDAPLMRTSL
ncbi:hypothetical protein BGP77_01965 [Saccharospirillum sp. MSK14-1]|nr:hypothetical protein BGP77_01965 [Saccharospirillum sp. MSK14-1]